MATQELTYLRRSLTLVAAVLLASCGPQTPATDGGTGGGGGGGAGGGGGGGGGQDAGTYKPAFVQLSSRDERGLPGFPRGRGGFAGAGFYERDSLALQANGWTCVTGQHGPCSAQVCSRDGGQVGSDPRLELSAGVITVTGTRPSVVLTPVDGGTPLYAFYNSGSDALFDGGEQLTVTAAGGIVPAFTASFVAPQLISYLPAGGADGGAVETIVRGSPLTLRWVAVPAGVLRVQLHTDDAPAFGLPTATEDILCRFNATSGLDVVPGPATNALRQGTGRMTLASENGIETIAGGWRVNVSGTHSAIGPNESPSQIIRVQ